MSDGLSSRKAPFLQTFLLADEINRTPPKTQAALLEAMQEKTVSSGGRLQTGRTFLCS